MKYICLFYHEEQKIAALSDSELERLIGGCIAYVGRLAESGCLVASSGLQSPRTASTVRRANGEVLLTDGPFAETKEVLGGFTIVEARDLNEAIQIATKFPTGALGSIEVRPVIDMSEEPSDALDRRLATCYRRAAQSAQNGHPVPEDSETVSVS